MTAPKPRLDLDATRERLRTLGCGYAAERPGDLLGEAVRAEIAPHAFLEQLLAVELSGREERRVKTSLKVSNLPLAQTAISSSVTPRCREVARSARRSSSMAFEKDMAGPAG